MLTDPLRRHDQAGLTLVELVVAMFLLAILGTMLTTSIRVVARTSSGVTERVDAQSQARVALGALTRDIRLAASPPGSTSTPILVAEADRIEFTANVDQIALPALITMEKVADGLRETQVDASIDDGDVVYTGTPVQRYLARDVREGDGPIFTYYAADGSELGDVDGDVASADRGRIALVEISVTVKPVETSAARATVLTSTVRLVNEMDR